MFTGPGFAEVLAYHPASQAVMRASPIVTYLTTPDGEGFAASFDHDLLSEVSPIASAAAELAIPSVAFIEIPRDVRFRATGDAPSATPLRYEALLPIGSRDPLHSGRDLPMNRVTYDLDYETGYLVRTTYSSDDPEQPSAVFAIQSERRFGVWFVAPSHGTATLERAWEVDESFFSPDGLRSTVAMVREHMWNERQDSLEEGRLQSREGDRLSTSTKVGIIAGVVVLIAVAAIIRQRLRA